MALKPFVWPIRDLIICSQHWIEGLSVSSRQPLSFFWIADLPTRPRKLLTVGAKVQTEAPNN